MKKKITITVTCSGFITMLFSIEPWIIQGKSIENSNWIMFCVGSFVFSVGLYMITHIDDFNRANESMYICENCENIGKKINETVPTCESCKKIMVPLAGFYENHPEKRN